MRRSLRILPAVSFFVLLLFVQLNVYGQQPPYKLVTTIPIGGESKWDYLACDQLSGMIYISHGDRVTVVSGKTNSVVGEILHTDGVHGIVIAPELHRGYTSNGRSSSVTIFDPVTLQSVDTVSLGAGKGPDCILYEPFTKRVFTFNGKSNDASVIDAVTGKVIGSIPLGGKPEFATCDSVGAIYDAIESTNEVVMIDAKSMKIVARWKTGSGTEPSGIALDAKNKLLFVGCSNSKLVVMDSKSGKVLSTIATGKGTDASAFNPQTNTAYTSNGEGTVTIVSSGPGQTCSSLGNLKTQRGARTMAIDYAHDNLYLVTAEYENADPATPNARPKAKPNSFILLKYGR